MENDNFFSNIIRKGRRARYGRDASYVMPVKRSETNESLNEAAKPRDEARIEIEWPGLDSLDGRDVAKLPRTTFCRTRQPALH